MADTEQEVKFHKREAEGDLKSEKESARKPRQEK